MSELTPEDHRRSRRDLARELNGALAIYEAGQGNPFIDGVITALSWALGLADVEPTLDITLSTFMPTPQQAEWYRTVPQRLAAERRRPSLHPRGAIS